MSTQSQYKNLSFEQALKACKAIIFLAVTSNELQEGKRTPQQADLVLSNHEQYLLPEFRVVHTEENENVTIYDQTAKVGEIAIFKGSFKEFNNSEVYKRQKKVMDLLDWEFFQDVVNIITQSGARILIDPAELEGAVHKVWEQRTQK